VGGREREIYNIFFFIYLKKNKKILYIFPIYPPPIYRWPMAEPDRGGPETDFLKTACPHAPYAKTHPNASESPKLDIFFEIWGVHVGIFKKVMTTT
jgi:hypothetical protein